MGSNGSPVTTPPASCTSNTPDAGRISNLLDFELRTSEGDEVSEFPYTLESDWDVDVREYWQGLDIDVEINRDEIGEDNP